MWRVDIVDFSGSRTALYNIPQKPRDIQAKAFSTAFDRTIAFGTVMDSSQMMQASGFGRCFE